MTTGSDDLRDHVLTAANPVRETEVARHLPDSVGDAVIREIVRSTPRSPTSAALHRFRTLADSVRTPSWGRVGFVAVLVVVAGGALALNSLRPSPADRGSTDGAGPAAGGETEVGRTGTLVVPGSSTTVVAPVTGADDRRDQPTPTTEQVGGAPDPGDSGAIGSESAPTLTPSESESEAGPESNPAPGALDRRCVSIEPEDLTMTGSWIVKTDPSASGSRYVVWDGPAAESTEVEPGATLIADFEIGVPGTYRFSWATRRPGGEARSRILVPEAGRFGPIDGGSYDGFVSVVGGGGGGFGWAATADVGGALSDLAIEFTDPGTYTLLIAPAVPDHQIDRIILHHDTIDLAAAISGTCG